MKPGQYFIVLLLAVVCVTLTVALIVTEHTNQQLQVKLQARQQALNQGILGQQAQQISGGVLQEMASASVRSSDIRQLLEKYGYRVSSSQSQGAAVDSPEQELEKSTNIVVPIP